MCTRSIAPMCIQVKDHSRVILEQLQQLRLQTGLVDLDIVCEDHHINVHKVVMAACSKFFKEQLCKQNVQVPVILRLEDFGLELKREALSYIIEFVYCGEVNIPGEKLTEVCQAAHTLGVVGLEHLPVPAETQRPAFLSKEHLQIADESELRGNMNNYNSLPGVSQPAQHNKFSMDMNNMNPFFMNNNPNTNDIILLQSADDDNRNNEPDIIPLSFGDNTVVTHSSDMLGSPSSRLYNTNNSINLNDKINLIVSEPSALSGEQYRIIPEMLPDDATFQQDSIDSCLPFTFPHTNTNLSDSPHSLSSMKSNNENMSTVSRTPVRHHNLQSPVIPAEVSLPSSAPASHSNSLQALFEAASSELVSASSSDHLTKYSPVSNIVFSSPSSNSVVSSSLSSRQSSSPAESTLKKTSPVVSTRGKHNSMSGKLRVINQGIHSENIQSPSCMEKSRRRSGGVTVGHQETISTLNIGQDESETDHDDDTGDVDTSSGGNDPAGPGVSGSGSGVFDNEMWSSNKSWTHPVESVDTSVPTSGAVWQLPSTEQPVVTSGHWPRVDTCSVPHVSRNLGTDLPVTTIPWNTPVVTMVPLSQCSVTSTSVSTRDTPPSVSVSWTQPQTSSSPSPCNIVPDLSSVPSTGQVSNTGVFPGHGTQTSAADNTNPVIPVNDPTSCSGGLIKTTVRTDDHMMLAIRSGIPLALQNKAIRSGVPIGPFQNKRKRKSRCSQDSGKLKRKAGDADNNAGALSGGNKRGDLEVRKDLMNHESENVFVNDELCASTSNIVSKMETKQDSNTSGSQLHVKTVKKLNSDAVIAELDLSVVCDLNTSDLSGGENSLSKYQFSCVKCNMIFLSSSELKRHSQTVHGKEETILCQVCNEGCVGREKFMMHLYKNHGIGEMFRCEDCSFETPVKDVYIKHLSSQHMPEEDQKKKCPKCEKVFKTKTGLNLHLKQHFDDSLYSCPACDFKTPQKLNLIKHTTAKHGMDIDGKQLVASFQCESCDFKCIAEHMLKNHVMRKHTLKSAMRFRCSSCNYATVEKSALDKHMRFKHTNERPFMCGTCGFSTHTASAMARHKRSHENIKPHKCEICSHEYADKKRLRDHMYIHSDEKPFSCQLCGYSCRRKDNLVQHIKKQHGHTKAEKSEDVVVNTENKSDNMNQSDLEPPKPSCSIPGTNVPVVAVKSSADMIHSDELSDESETVTTIVANTDDIIVVCQNTS